METIHRSGKDLLEIIDDILEISKIEAGRIEIKPADFSFDELSNDLEGMFRSRCDAKGLPLVVERDDHLPTFFYGDRVKLKQVFMNLLSNAVKFTAHGGIALRVRSDVYQDEVSKKTDLVWLTVEVEDSGIGISKEDQIKLFRPFERAVNMQQTQGTGLGLVISREYIKLFGGDIQVKSEPGKGSCFRFNVVMRIGKAFPKEDRPAYRHVIGLEPGTGPVRVLVVDDNLDNQELLKALLVPVGFELRKAFEGRQALELFKQFAPHAVLMDMRMPGMDGYQTTRRIKRTDEGRATPVIALTASAFEEGKQKTMDAGVDAFIRKPFQCQELFDILEQWLGLRYVYNDAVEAKPSAPTRQAVSVLPEGLKAALRQTVEEGDMGQFLELLEQVAESHLDLVNALRRLANAFDYKSLRRLLK